MDCFVSEDAEVYPILPLAAFTAPILPKSMEALLTHALKRGGVPAVRWLGTGL
mgnify:CR=1 FL=1